MISPRHCENLRVALRRLTERERSDLLCSAVLGRLATLDRDGYPHVTPIWFHWDGEAVRMTSLEDKPHVHRLRNDARVGFVVDIEDEERSDGERPNRQVRITGDAVLVSDEGGDWTRSITLKYLAGLSAEARAEARAAQSRVVIELRPTTVVGVASV